MATVINNPAPTSNQSSGVGFFAGVLLLILFLVALLYYGLPVLRRSVTFGSPQISVPDRVQVDVNQTGGTPANTE